MHCYKYLEMENGGEIPHYNKMQALPNIWLNGLVTFDSVVEQIENSLDILRTNAVNVDFTDAEIRTQYANDILYLKQFFERAEKLARDGL